MLVLIISWLILPMISTTLENRQVDHNYYSMLVEHENPELFAKYFVNMSSTVHSQVYKSASAAEKVGFHFPFYGHLMETFYVTTLGFLSFVPRIHSLMKTVQYVAPYMLYDPINEMVVQYHDDNGDRFAVQWRFPDSSVVQVSVSVCLQ